MKKALSLILALAMALSLAACGGGKTETPSDSNTPADNTSAEPTKLSLILRGGTYADVIKECLPAFEAEHNVVCEVQELSEGDLYSGIALDAINDKGSYDLCMVDGSWMAEFTENGVLANLTELGYSLDEDVIPATTAICYVGDDLYLAPYYGNVTVLLYNKANVEAAGYTGDTILSLEDMLAICEKAKADGKLGFIYRGDSQNNLVVDFLPILLSYGGWVIDSNNQPTVNTPEFKDAMNFYLKLIATGSAQVKDDLIASCDTGAGTMGVGWPGWYTPTADTAADYCAITGAVAKGGETHNANVYGVWTIGIPNNSQNKELATELLSYLMDKDVQKSTVPSGGVPCRYSSLLMGVIYLLVTLMGVWSRGALEAAPNGGTALAQIAQHYLGKAGLLVLAATVTLACLKTAVGLITSCAETFVGMFPKGLSYRNWVFVFTGISFLLANVGLTAIITYAVPVLMFLYPLAITLILLALLGHFFDHDRAVYAWVTGLTLVAAFYDLLRTLPDHLRAVLHVNGLVDTVGKALPFATIGLGWICPAILGLVIGLIFRAVRPKKA